MASAVAICAMLVFDSLATGATEAQAGNIDEPRVEEPGPENMENESNRVFRYRV